MRDWIVPSRVPHQRHTVVRSHPPRSIAGLLVHFRHVENLYRIGDTRCEPGELHALRRLTHYAGNLPRWTIFGRCRQRQRFVRLVRAGRYSEEAVRTRVIQRPVNNGQPVRCAEILETRFSALFASGPWARNLVKTLLSQSTLFLRIADGRRICFGCVFLPAGQRTQFSVYRAI
jgi:hypothetical protein